MPKKYEYNPLLRSGLDLSSKGQDSQSAVKEYDDSELRERIEELENKEQTEFIAGENVEITDNGDGSKTINATKTNTEYTAGKLIEIDAGDANRIDSLVPTVKHELIYSDDNDSLTTKQLLFTDGLVTDNEDDYNVCKGTLAESFANVFNSFIPFCIHPKDTTFGIGEQSQIPYPVHSSGRSGHDQWVYNPVTDEISNLTNSTTFTGFLSPNKYGKYDITTDFGILSTYDQRHNDGTQFILTSKIVNVDGQDYLCMLVANLVNNYGDCICEGLYGMNYDGTSSSDGYSSANKHTISVFALKIPLPIDDAFIERYYPFNINGNNFADGAFLFTHGFPKLCEDGYAAVILSPEDGLNVVPFVGYQNDTTNRFIRMRAQRAGNVFNLFPSNPFLYQPQNYDEGVDRESIAGAALNGNSIIINLNNQSVRYRYYDSGEEEFKVISVADLSETAQEILGLLQGNGAYGYAQESSPYSVFYGVSLNLSNLILRTDTNEVMKLHLGEWIATGQLPIDLFTGSRIAYNDITKKLFYSDGSEIKQISSAGDGGSGDTNPKPIIREEKIVFENTSSTIYASDVDCIVVDVDCYNCSDVRFNGSVISAGANIEHDVIYNMSVAITSDNAIVILKTQEL